MIHQLPLYFPYAKGAPAGSEWSQSVVESMLVQFVAQWRRSLTAMLPAEVDVQVLDLQLKPYARYTEDVSPQADIQVFEIEALQCLCSWSLDLGWVSTAVDFLFGGSGRIPLRDPNRRWTPIELGVRQRMLEALATAYEGAWQSIYPIRLQMLRQERSLASLRLASAGEEMLHARFSLSFNQVQMQMDLCMPKHALECLNPASLQEGPEDAPSELSTAWNRGLQHQLQSAGVEAVAILSEKPMTVAQLLSLSIGQVIPLDLAAPVRMLVDGAPILSGRYGVRNGRYAVKVEHVHSQHAALNNLTADSAGVSDKPAADQAILASAAEAIHEFNEQVLKDQGGL